MRQFPRIILAGLSGGSGKTIVSLGLCRAWARQGMQVKPFKKGPDYIDAAWLGLASGAPATNLDPFLMTEEAVKALFMEKMDGFDVGVIEGNRGLFDGKDVEGSLSTAELARVVRGPVVLVIDATKMTRTVAAIVNGMNSFEDDLRISGVVLNRTAGPRHRKILRESIETYTDVPIVGMLPKIKDNPIPERHMGLWSDREMNGAGVLDPIADMIEQELDLGMLTRIARHSSSLGYSDVQLWSEKAEGDQPVIGVARDAALWFYYPENIEALERAGAKIEYVSIVSGEDWPELDGLYLGGGFPETLAADIAANEKIRAHVKGLSDSGMPIFAECGGFMYLGESLEYEGKTYPMAGVFPLATSLCARPQGLGYIEADVVAENPFLTKGTRIRGHEFHYSYCVNSSDLDLAYALRLTRGSGIHNGLDGLVHRNTFAGYAHTHALGIPEWAPNFVAAAQAYAARRK